MSSLRDIFVLVTALAILVIYLSFSNSYVSELSMRLIRFGADNSSLTVGLLLLNVALTIYGWRRYKDATAELVERAAAEQRTHTLAATDPLTGLLNRRSFAQAISEMCVAARKRRQTVALLTVDLDGLKHVNDVYGHMTGDSLLRMASEIIQSAVPQDAVTARLGGDEFAAAMAFDSTAPSEIDRIADNIIDRLGKPFDLAGVHAHISASAGLAATGPECSGVDALMRRADIALHVAKKLGRARYAWFDASMERELQQRNSLEAELRSGIPVGEIVPYFEPQIDLVTQSLHGFEMLARWKHPKRGIIPPEEFIDIAEECGMIGDLSMSVMRQAFEEAKGWDPVLMLSVNISPVQLKDTWLAEKITKLLIETRFPAERLEIEITESSFFENLGLAQPIIASLKNQGIKLALDDFGTGYSSLAHLRSLPFDRIKIDRSFIEMVNENAECATIVTAITRLAESLGLAVTAEGIEDEVIEARLRSIGAYQGQGWLFGRPVPASDVRKMLSARALLPGPRPVKLGEPVKKAGNG